MPRDCSGPEGRAQVRVKTICMFLLLALLYPVHGMRGANDTTAPGEFDPGVPDLPSTYVPSDDTTVVLPSKGSDLENAVLKRLPATLYVREHPSYSNRGPEVDRYLASCGGKTPAKWCAAVVRYQITEAARAGGLETHWRPLANCTDIYRWAQKHNLIRTRAVVGCVFLVPRGDGTFCHTGFVVDILDGGRVVTIEGNSNNNGSHDGNGVFKLRSRKQSSLVYVKIA